jgi:arylamine N-acetyltransferase
MASRVQSEVIMFTSRRTDARSGVERPRSHRRASSSNSLLLQVESPEGPYLADVGFRNLAPTAPLLLAPHVEQHTPHGLMRFIEVNGELTLQQLPV